MQRNRPGEVRWLILDDDPDVRAIVQGMCLVWGIDLIELRDGYEGMAWVGQVRGGTYLGPIPELALVDIRMPGPPGDAVAHQMRALPELDPMAIVLMTAYRLTKEEQQDVMEVAQADLFLTKPLPRLFEFNLLIQKTIIAHKRGKPGESRAAPDEPSPPP